MTYLKYGVKTEQMKAVNKFKHLMWKKRPELMSRMLGRETQFVLPPEQIDGAFDRSALVKNFDIPGPSLQKSRSFDAHDRVPIDGALAAEGVTRDLDTGELSKAARPVAIRDDSERTIKAEHTATSAQDHQTRSQSAGERGHAHDLMSEEPRFLGIGAGTIGSPEPSRSEEHNDELAPPDTNIVAESPTAAEFNIYDTAYGEEVERIRAAQGETAKVYLTRRVDSKKEYKSDKNMMGVPDSSDVKGTPHAGWTGLVEAARAKGQKSETSSQHDNDAEEKPVATASKGESLMGRIKDTREGAGLVYENVGLKVAATHQGVRNSMEMEMDRRGMPRTKEGWRTKSGELKKDMGDRHEKAMEGGRSALSNVMQKVRCNRKETDGDAFEAGKRDAM